MQSPDLIKQINELQEEINRIRADVNRKFSTKILLTIKKVHFIWGLIIAIMLSAAIAFAARINFTPGTAISSSAVNANFTELYNLSTVGFSGSKSTDQNLGIGSSAVISFESTDYNDGSFAANTYTVAHSGTYLLIMNITESTCYGIRYSPDGKILPGSVYLSARVNGTPAASAMVGNFITAIYLVTGEVVDFYVDGTECSSVGATINSGSRVLLKKLF